MNSPHKIKELIGDRPYSIDTVGMSGSQVIFFADMVLKIAQQQEESDTEHMMMTWLAGKLPVPRVLCHEKENGVSYLLMSRLKGRIACSEELLANPKHLLKLLADGLRMLWDVDAGKCPHCNSLDNKLRQAEIRVQKGLCDVEDAEPATYGANGFENPEKLLQWLKENRPDEELVFSHGDYCLPNIIIEEDRINGFVDLCRSGIADKYQDIALCYRSLQHNYDGRYGGKVYEGFDAALLFDELNMVPDWQKISYYILLDELF